MDTTESAAAFLAAVADLSEAPTGTVRTTLHTASAAAEDWSPPPPVAVRPHRPSATGCPSSTTAQAAT